jgi:aldehyde:ferredoxin oxidoreductase
MSYGYRNQLLRINLSDRTYGVEEPGDQFYRKLLGGRAAVAQILLREIPSETSPLEVGNVLVFMTGPVTGLPVAGSGRHCVGAKSPLTNTYGDADAGGFWGAELKHVGYDGLIIEGVSDYPIYLYVHNGGVEFRPAQHLWGRPISEVHQAIIQELGDSKVRVAQAGPAGEQMVRFACIVHDLHHFAGRSGLGAVMGSKRLRAVAVRGRQAIPVADPARLREVARWVADNFRDFVYGLSELGTAEYVASVNYLGGLPTRNFRRGSFEHAEELSGETMAKTIVAGKKGCYACPVRCKRLTNVAGDGEDKQIYGGPEYETLAALGSNCGIGDLGAVARANALCADYGMDTISTGVVIAFAMECFEGGLIGPQDTDGLDVTFGSAEAMLTLVHKIARREGIGQFLSEGVARASQEIGRGAEAFAMHVKGQEVPMHDPRWKPGLGIGYAVGPGGADHAINLHDEVYTRPNRFMDSDLFPEIHPLPARELSRDKMRLLIHESHRRGLFTCLGLCYFIPYDWSQLLTLAEASTGWETTVASLLLAVERGTTLARLFNSREGVDESADRLPDRFFSPLQSGPPDAPAMDAKEVPQAIRHYYELMGWDPTGVPTAERLAQLGLPLPD